MEEIKNQKSKNEDLNDNELSVELLTVVGNTIVEFKKSQLAWRTCWQWQTSAMSLACQVYWMHPCCKIISTS